MVRLSALLLLLWLPGAAQTKNQTRDLPDIRAITGVVTDKRGNALPGAAVQLENSATLAIMSCITAKDGGYHFSNLDSDIDYTVKAKYRRYWSSRRKISKFNSSKHPEVNLMIPIE
jgi:hypothetical protein